MGHGSRSPRKTGRTISLIAAAVAVLCLALPGAALANHSTAPGWYLAESHCRSGDRAYSDVSVLGRRGVGRRRGALPPAQHGRGTHLPASAHDGRQRLLQHGRLRLIDARASRAGTNDGIYRTVNGGSTWTLVQAITAGTVDDLFALDATHAWVQVSRGTNEGQYRTTNGTTWTKTTPPRLPRRRRSSPT